MPTANDALDRIVQQAGSLYTLPGVAMKVLELTANPAVDVPALKACIENDPALTTKILRVVNSSLFGLSREVSDLNQALALLGSKPLKLLVLGFSLPEGLFRDPGGSILQHYWRRTLTRAVAAREISERVHRSSGDDAFITALLADLGLLVLLQEFGQPLVRFVDRVQAEHGDLLAMERATLGFDHREISCRLLSDWQLPEMLIDAIAAGGEAEPTAALSDEARLLTRIVELAELTAQLLADGNQHVMGELVEQAQSAAGMDGAALLELLHGLEQKVDQLAEVLSLDLATDADYQGVLAEAHTQLVQVAADAAGDLVRHRTAAMSAKCDTLMLLDEVRSLGQVVEEFASRPQATRRRPEAAHQRVAATSVQKTSASHRKGKKSRDDAETLKPADDDPALLGTLTSVAATCRHARCAMSLLYVEVDHYGDLVFRLGESAAEDVLEIAEAVCRGVDHPQSECLHIASARFAVVLADCDRRQAVALANQIREAIPELAPSTSGPPVSVSIGAASVALPPRNFHPAEVIASADRCLYGAQSSGGGAVKSIELF